MADALWSTLVGFAGSKRKKGQPPDLEVHDLSTPVSRRLSFSDASDAGGKNIAKTKPGFTRVDLSKYADKGPRQPPEMESEDDQCNETQLPSPMPTRQDIENEVLAQLEPELGDSTAGKDTDKPRRKQGKEQKKPEEDEEAQAVGKGKRAKSSGASDRKEGPKHKEDKATSTRQSKVKDTAKTKELTNKAVARSEDKQEPAILQAEGSSNHCEDTPSKTGHTQAKESKKGKAIPASGKESKEGKAKKAKEAGSKEQKPAQDVPSSKQSNTKSKDKQDTDTDKASMTSMATRTAAEQANKDAATTVECAERPTTKRVPSKKSSACGLQHAQSKAAAAPATKSSDKKGQDEPPEEKTKGKVAKNKGAKNASKQGQRADAGEANKENAAKADKCQDSSREDTQEPSQPPAKKTKKGAIAEKTETGSAHDKATKQDECQESEPGKSDAGKQPPPSDVASLLRSDTAEIQEEYDKKVKMRVYKARKARFYRSLESQEPSTGSHLYSTCLPIGFQSKILRHSKSGRAARGCR